MNKPKSIRDFLQAKVPALMQRPDDFLTFIESGQVVSTQSANPSFVYHYKLNLVVLDFNGHADEIMLPILIWLRINQPDILTGEPNDKFTFEAEILTNETTDISISLQLTERVKVTVDGDTLTTHHCGEPPLDDLSGPTDWQLFTGNVQVLPTPLA